MDEPALEAAIAASRMQLEQVEAAIAALRAASGDGRRCGAGAPDGREGGPPDGREGGPPDGREGGPPYGREGGPPYGREGGAPYGREGGPPDGWNGGPPYGREGGPPYGREGGAPYGREGGPPDGREGGAPDGREGGAPDGREGGPPDGREGGAPDGREGGPPDGREGGPPDGREGGPPDGREGGPPDGRDGEAHMQVLLELRAGVQEFLELTEASLLAARKSSLLALLEETKCAGEQGPSEEKHAGGTSDRVIGVKGQESNSVPGDGVNGQDEVPCSQKEAMDDDSFCGVRCLAPYRNSRGALQFHHAMLSGRASGPEGVDAVCVLFLFPTDRSLKPCSFYLEGRCRFAECCRFSHGVVVPCNQLREFEEPDVASLRTGDMCLARHEDDVWYAATITDMADGYYTVKFDSLLLKERVVEADGIIPIPRTETEETSSSSSEDSDGGEGAGPQKEERVHLLQQESDYDMADGGYVKLVECADKGPPLLGLWEAHTRGVGSRLLTKMGYQQGRGLGPKGDGRILPVDVVVLPAGRSLDSCAAILQHHRETGEMTVGGMVAGGQQPHPKRRKTHQPASSAGQSSYGRQKRANVFEFLNQKLGGNEKSRKFAKDEMTDKFERLEQRGSTAFRGDAAWHRELGVLASQTAERVSQKQREVERLKEALGRNAGRDAVITAKVETRLGETMQSLKELRAQERKLQQKRERAETHRSMTEF